MTVFRCGRLFQKKGNRHTRQNRVDGWNLKPFQCVIYRFIPITSACPACCDRRMPNEVSTFRRYRRMAFSTATPVSCRNGTGNSGFSKTRIHPLIQTFIYITNCYLIVHGSLELLHSQRAVVDPAYRFRFYTSGYKYSNNL